MTWVRPNGLYPIFGPIGICHLLVWDQQAVLIDTGLLTEAWSVKRRLRQLGLPPTALTTILLTHGHLDHTAGAAALQNWSGAKVWIHPADLDHVVGKHNYPTTAMWCDRLERLGRLLLNYQPPRIDGELSANQILPFWGGLRVIHLPGHTAGHCGFFSERHRILFSGDLFANYSGKVNLPPRFLNTDSRALRDSARRAAAMNPQFVLPNHTWNYDGSVQASALGSLRLGKRPNAHRS
jgi:glyoxylase-like metal-dependent hydrolase (beta-lactamase superfamily II)